MLDSLISFKPYGEMSKLSKMYLIILNNIEIDNSSGLTINKHVIQIHKIGRSMEYHSL